MNPITALINLITAKRRAAQEHAEFITLIRQAAALLAAGRPLGHLWSEVAQAHQPCQDSPEPHNPDPKCCMHHVLVAQRAAALVNAPYFADVTGPSPAAGWQQLSATLTLAQDTGMSLAAILYRLADALEAGEDAQQARAAASAGPKATDSPLAWLPVAGLGLAHLLGESLGELISTVNGWNHLLAICVPDVLVRIWYALIVCTALYPIHNL